MKVISFANKKGGVGKTTLSLNVSAYLASKKKKVLLIDSDAQSNITKTLLDFVPEKSLFDVLTNEVDLNDIIHKTNIKNLDLAVNNSDFSDIDIEITKYSDCEFKLKQAIDKLNFKYDFIIIDCNPAFNYATFNALIASNDVIIPIQDCGHSTDGLIEFNKDIEDVKAINSDLNLKAIVLNNVDKKTSLYKKLITEIEDVYPNKLAKNILFQYQLYKKLTFNGKTVIDYKLSKPYKEISQLLKELKYV